MLKTSGSTESITQLGEGVVRVDGNNRTGYNKSQLDEYEIDDVEVDVGEVYNEVEKKD